MRTMIWITMAALCWAAPSWAQKPGDRYRAQVQTLTKARAEARAELKKARGDTRAQWGELANIYKQMANQQQEAGARADAGNRRPLDAKSYRRLEGRRDGLLRKLGRYRGPAARGTPAGLRGDAKQLRAAAKHSWSRRMFYLGSAKRAKQAEQPSKARSYEALARIYLEMWREQRKAADRLEKKQPVESARFRTLEAQRDRLRDQLSRKPAPRR